MEVATFHRRQLNPVGSFFNLDDVSGVKELAGVNLLDKVTRGRERHCDRRAKVLELSSWWSKGISSCHCNELSFGPYRVAEGDQFSSLPTHRLQLPTKPAFGPVPRGVAPKALIQAGSRQEGSCTA